MKKQLKKTEIKEREENKQRVKNILFKVLHGVSYALSTCFIAVCVVACTQSNANKTNSNKQKQNEYSYVEIQNVKQRLLDSSSEESSSEEVSYPIYDDVHYEITITEYQFYNYTWQNLYDLFSTIYNEDTYAPLYYFNTIDNEYEFYYSSLIDGSIRYTYDNHSIDLIYNSTQYNNANGTNFLNYQFAFDNNNVEETGNVVISDDNQTNDTWALLKSAIQADIQANEGTINVGIFEGLTESVVDFVSTLNVGLSAIIGIFWNSTSSALTPLGLLTVIVVSVSLVYFVFRLIIGLIRLRG